MSDSGYSPALPEYICMYCMLLYAEMERERETVFEVGDLWTCQRSSQQEAEIQLVGKSMLGSPLWLRSTCLKKLEDFTVNRNVIVRTTWKY